MHATSLALTLSSGTSDPASSGCVSISSTFGKQWSFSPSSSFFFKLKLYILLY
ncbi:hypothetical protein GW17_00036296 [Ensete ventricosum]|nr:hypothetical protein GW17_00036296 [Ensete ventricosum]RZR80544.1 hypothetical protein BHM03_00006591 [Ensete ventricosum]